MTQAEAAIDGVTLSTNIAIYMTRANFQVLQYIYLRSQWEGSRLITTYGKAVQERIGVYNAQKYVCT